MFVSFKNNFKNIFHKKDEYGNETYGDQGSQASDLNNNKQTFTLGRRSRNLQEKDKKLRSFSISGARHAVSSLDVSLHGQQNLSDNANKAGSRVSISDFKNSLFQKNKFSTINSNKANNKAQLYGEEPSTQSTVQATKTSESALPSYNNSALGYDEDDDYHSSSEESDTDYKFPEISQIVEKPSMYKPVKKEDPFLKDLQAKLQLKQRQRQEKVEQKKDNSTSPVHKFANNLLKSASATRKEQTPDAASATKRFNMQSFSLNKTVRYNNNTTKK